ncbi:unnamed protein product, partial [Symbiodinium pilosum]
LDDRIDAGGSDGSPVSPSFGAGLLQGSSLRQAAAANVANEDSNPFAVGSGEGNPFGEEDGLDDDHQNEKPDSTNPFNRCTVQEGQGMSGNPFVFKSEEGQETNPFADKLTRMDGANPFGESAASDCASSSSDQDPGNPFELDRQDAGASAAALEAAPEQLQQFGSPASMVEESQHDLTCFESPASFGEAASASRNAFVSRPVCLDLTADSTSTSPRVTSLMPGAAPSLEMWRRPSPRQLPGGLAGCLCGPGMSRVEHDLDEELKQVVEAQSLEAAIAASDASMCRGRLDTADIKNWKWRDHAAEEGHQVLRNCTHSLSDMLTDEDWGYFSYELLLLSRYFLREGSPALDQVSALIPICRVRLGINSQLHHHIVELAKPTGNEAFSPLDVRYRAALLLRLWSSWEAFEYGTVADSGRDWTQKWIYMQLRVLKGCILERALQLHSEGHEDLSACGRCLRAIRELTEEGYMPLFMGRPWSTFFCHRECFQWHLIGN